MKTVRHIYYTGLTILLVLAVPVLATAQAPKLDNPLTSNSILCFIKDLVGAIRTLALPLIVLFIIISGFKFVTAGGSDDDLQEAKQMILYTVIGAAIILGASLIADLLINTAANLGAEVGGASCT